MMDKPFTYEIRVEGYLTERWSDWFGGLAIARDSDGTTLITGTFEDQAALLGILAKIQGLNLILISVCRQLKTNQTNNLGEKSPMYW